MDRDKILGECISNIEARLAKQHAAKLQLLDELIELDLSIQADTDVLAGVRSVLARS